MTLSQAPDGSVCDVDHRGEVLRVWVTSGGPGQKVIFARVRQNNAWTGPLPLAPETKVVRVVAASLRLIEEEPLVKRPEEV